MGENAEMIIDGLVDEYTGEWIDGKAPGFPRHFGRKKRLKADAGKERCEQCGKRFKTKQGVTDHTMDVHGDRKRDAYGNLEKMPPKCKEFKQREKGLR